MPSQLPSRDAMVRLAEAAQQYREAFREVQRALLDEDLGRVPSWVFAVDRLPLEEVEDLSPRLARLEARRRRWRVALHAMAELIALEDTGESLRAPPDTSQLDTADESNLPRLDRFITVVNFARQGNVIYVNGGFEPVERTSPSEEDDKDTFELPPPRERGPDEERRRR